MSPALVGRFLTTEPPGKPVGSYYLPVTDSTSCLHSTRSFFLPDEYTTSVVQVSTVPRCKDFLFWTHLESGGHALWTVKKLAE